MKHNNKKTVKISNIKRNRTIKHNNKKILSKNKEDILNTCIKNNYLLQYESITSKNNLEKIQKVRESYHKKNTRYINVLKNELKKNNLNNIPKKFHPNQDFYTYINHTWLDIETSKLLKDPKYFVEVDDFRIVQNKVYYELMDQLREFIVKNKNTPKGKSVNNLLISLETTDLNQLRYTSKVVECIIDKYIEKESLYDLLAHINQNGIVSWQCPIQWTVDPDEKNVKKYISHLSGPQLGLYDYMLYVDDPNDTKKQKEFKKLVKEKYFIFIKQVFEACDITFNGGINPNDIWDVELELLDAMGCTGKKKEDPNFYNVVSRKELEEDYNFDWSLFAEKIGYDSKNIPQKVILSGTNSFKCLVDLVKKKWNTKKWRTYWLYIYNKQSIRFLNETRNIYFNFYEKFLKGSVKPFPDEIYPIFGVSFCFNTLLTDLYVNKNKNPLYENYVKNLGNDIKYIFYKKIERNKWLSPLTKKSALYKLEKLEFVIGKPKNMLEDPIINYGKKNIFENILKINDWKLAKFIELEGNDVIDIPIIDWNNFKLVGTQAYMVNAYYRPTSNSIYVPQAYIQKPFIDLDQRGIEYNLAYMGYTLGHELSHSLDDMGSKFDANGNLNNWWTEEDRKVFNSKIRNVVKQYEEFAARDGIIFDAKIGVGEDLADISGLSLVEEYLYYYQIIKDDISIIKKISLETFYIYSAIQSRQKILANAIPAQLKMNPHPLEKYRCNCPLSRLTLFRNIYNVSKGDNMWWNNTDTIW